MKSIEKKRYHQPVIKMIKIHSLRPLAQSPDTGGSTGGQVNQTRGFVFEDEE
jgi:hypothetical protein